MIFVAFIILMNQIKSNQIKITFFAKQRTFGKNVPFNQKLKLIYDQYNIVLSHLFLHIIVCHNGMQCDEHSSIFFPFRLI